MHWAFRPRRTAEEFGQLSRSIELPNLHSRRKEAGVSIVASTGGHRSDSISVSSTTTDSIKAVWLTMLAGSA
jgi:hypothetical protein